MGVSKQQAVDNRQAIVAAASRLFRERGVDGVGLVELMKEAGFTQGGFYNHFKSKQDLASAVVTAALADGEHDLADGLGAPLAPGEDALRRQVEYYFSAAHRDNIEHGCPIAGLAGEVARLDGSVQANFAEGLEQTFDKIGALLPLSQGELAPRERAIALYSQMVGALVIARSVAGASSVLSEEVLASVRRVALAGLEDGQLRSGQ